MKKLLTAYFFLFHAALFAQQSPVSWTASNEADMRFIENKGQFDGRNKQSGSEILYVVDNGAMQIFFTKQGVTYYFEEKFRTPGRKKGDPNIPKYSKRYEVKHFTWEGANPNVALKGEDKVSDYSTYSFLTADKSSAYTYNDIRGYKKLVYKNLYPNIDVEYVFHPEIGIKYSVILHPGADASQVKMKYNDATQLSINSAGRVILPTFKGAIIEHAPVTFYAQNNSESIPSQFIQHDNTISFQLGNYNRSKTVVIDPWVQTPALSNSNGVWECEKDASGNAYIIAGDAPMRLRKYNSTGTLQWTYNTPWDTTAGDWLGTLATDLAGNSYVTNGSNAALVKVNTAGGLVWSVTGSIFPATEYWSVQFNCDQTRLVVGGTTLSFFPPAGSHGTIFDINTTNGNVIGSIDVASQRPGFLINDINEVRAITSSRNAKYYFLVLDTIGAINQNVSACSSEPLFKTNSTYNFGYKCENYRPSNGNSGICAIRANDQFVYTQNGTTLHKRSLVTGLPIASVAIPGGLSTATFGVNQTGNSGIDIDNCGNVYVGSGDRVIKYDSNLNPVTSVATPFRVYDVTVSYSGEIIVTGTTGNNSSSSRTGYVQAINMSACAPFTLTCCDATICPAGPFCSTDAPVNLVRGTAGGTWSGTGITNASTGTFSPAVAGVGTHTITYTLACGSDVTTIVINDCATLEVCIEPNGQYTVSGGSGPYTWQRGVPFQNCTACFFGICSPLCPGVPDTTWTTFATTATATPPGTFPIRVLDSGINELLLTSAAGLPNCSTLVCPTITVSVSTLSNLTCFGANDGSATMSASGGTGPYTFNWNPGPFTGATRTGLSAISYGVLATDANGCTGTGSVTITAPTAVSASASKTDATCAGNNGTASVTASGGTGAYTYVWSNAAITASISGLAPGNYSVTVRDGNNCSATASVTVSSTGGPTITQNSLVNVSCFGANDGAIGIAVSGGSPPYDFDWSNGAITEDISGLDGDNYSVTVIDALNCISIFNATINEPAALVVTGVVTDAGCGVPSGAIDQTITGGTLPYIINWSSGNVSEDLNGIPASNYSVTVTDNNSCSQTATYTVNAPGSFSISLVADSASCQGVADGGITSIISGGAAPFSYNWSNGTSNANLTGVAAGTYTVTVTDDNICTVAATATVSAPSVMTFTASITSVLCNSGNEGGIKLNPFGGTAPYTAIWSNDSTGLSLTDLAPGIYTATVTDANGCVADTAISLEAASIYSVEMVVTNAACDGAASGSVTVNLVDGTTPPYSYVWSTGDSTASIINIAPGSYSVTVSDSLNCLRYDTASVAAGNGLSILSTVIDASCPDKEDGSIATTVSGGTEPYSYLWNTQATTSSLTNIAAGIYSLTVTDENDCTGTDTVVVHVDSSGLIECDTLIIYDVFSPNGDGTNDTWIIDGLENYPDNELQIFNRWGNVVFEAQPYLNDWDGISKKEGALPSATYYYILNLHDAKETVHSGSVTLIR